MCRCKDKCGEVGEGPKWDRGMCMGWFWSGVVGGAGQIVGCWCRRGEMIGRWKLVREEQVNGGSGFVD